MWRRQQTVQCVSHGTVCCLRHIAQRPLLHIDLLGLGQLVQAGGNRIYRDSLKIISLASGKDRDRNLMHLCRSQNKYNIGRRFLQRF